MPRKSAADVKRRKLVSAAAELFDTYGYHRVSVSQAAEAVGLSKAALYHYFPSKEKILFAIHDEFIRELITRAERRIETEGPRDALVGVTSDILDLFDKYPGYVRVFLEHRRELGVADQNAIAEKRLRYAELVEGIIRAGIEEGEFRDLDPQMVARGLFGMTAWTVQWYEPGGEDSLTETAAFIADLLLGGLGVQEAAGSSQPASNAISTPASTSASISLSA